MYSNKYQSGPPSLNALVDYIFRYKFSRRYDGATPPSTPADLLRFNSVCLCSSSNSKQVVPSVLVSDHILTPAAATRIDRLKPNTIVLYETACRHNGRMNVLFADGSVRSISAAEAQAMLADLNAGRNTPPSLQKSRVGR
jgi:prepilin-type processing-associated H-X9-DG protein